MNAYWLIRLIRRWLPLLVLSPLVGGLAGYLVVQRIPSVYQATATLMVQPGDALISGIQDVQAAQDLAATYAEAIHTRRILSEAATQVGLDALPERELEVRVQARRVTGTRLLRITVDDTDSARAAQFANAVAEVFVKNNAATQASRFESSRNNLSKIIDQIQQDIDSRVAAIANLNAEPASPERDAQLLQLENNLTQTRTTYGNMVKSYEDLRVSEARGANTATVFDSAIPPADPARPNRSLTALLAAVSGLAVACGIVILSEFFDDRLDSGSRVSRVLGLRTLGALPIERASRRLRDANGRGSLGSYRLLANRLGIALQQTQSRSVLLTSPSAGEGKSTVTANMALALAEAGYRVILLDADVHSPAQMRLFELPNQYGLSTLLEAEPGSRIPALNETWSANLQVLTAGPAPSDPAGLLMSSRLSGVVDDLLGKCDILLIDAPALLSEPDGLILSSQVDAVVLLIDAQRTRGRAAVRAVESLRSSGSHILGTIINRAGKDAFEFVSTASTPAESSRERSSDRSRTEVSVGRQTVKLQEGLERD